MSDLEELQEYIGAKEILEKAYALVRKYGQIISDIDRYINRVPYEISVSNAGVSFPTIAESEFILNGNDWPTAKQLAEVLSDYINKRVKAKHLYDSLSAAQRGTIQPHPDI